MKVILLKDVKKQGKKDQVIDVSDGFAKNFLISKGLAVPYNTQNKTKLEREIKHRNELEKELIEENKVIKDKLANIILEFKAKTGNNGKMFGSISSKQIADELKNKGFSIDKKKIVIDYPIDSLGTYVVKINLHKEVVAEVKIHVE